MAEDPHAAAPSPIKPAPANSSYDRQAIIRQRNRAMALVLLGFVVLFFAITIVKVKF